MTPLDWWVWLGWSLALWGFPAAMMVVWGNCYTRVFGEPPCGPWAGTALHSLFLVNLAFVALYLFVFRKKTGPFALALLIGVVETVVTGVIWFWGSMNVSGSYF